MIALVVRAAWGLGLALACVSSSVGAFTQPGRAPAPLPPDPPPGEGVLCIWALTSAAVTIGRTCEAVRDPQFQPELERSVGRFEAFASAAGWTPAQIAQFERQQGGLGTHGANICISDSIDFYRHMSVPGPGALHALVDRLVSRPGRPTWGDCV